MATSTANYGLLKPDVNDPDDRDLWGGYLNDNFDDLDSIVGALDDAIGALGTAAAANTGTADGNVPVFASGGLDLADKLLKRPILQDIGEKVQSVSHSVSGGLTIDASAGNVIALAQSANITSMTISNPSPTGNLCAILIIRTKDNNATARTIAWPSGTKHPGGTAPTLTQTANAVDRFLLSTTDAGTTWYCDPLGAGYA